MSSSRSWSGSSSTTIAMFCIALRKRRGIDRNASATSCSNAFRSTRLRVRCLRELGAARELGALCGLRELCGLLFRRLAVAGAGDHEAEVVAVVADRTLIAQRFGPADSPSVQNQGARRARPPLLRHCAAQLLFDRFRIVALGNAN